MLKKTAIAFAAFVSLFVVATPPAHASLSQCTAAEICIWTAGSWTGSFAEYDGGTIYQAPGHCWKFAAGTFNNSTSSYAAKFAVDGYVIRYYDNNSCTGTYFQESNPPFAFDHMPSGWNDRVGSISVIQG